MCVYMTVMHIVVGMLLKVAHEMTDFIFQAEQQASKVCRDSTSMHVCLWRGLV